MTPVERVKKWKQENPEKYQALRKRMSKRPACRAAQKRYKKKPIVAARSREQNRVRMLSPKAKKAYRKSAGLPEPTRAIPDVCECCGGLATGSKRKDGSAPSLHLDHDHKAGNFRGWICGKCNQGIGLLGDDLSGVLRAVAYLLKPGG